MSFNEFVKELSGGRVEGELLKTIFYSLVTSFLLLGILYSLIFRNIPDFINKYGFFVFLSALSFALVMPAIRQARAYKKFPCMSGMMVGMTIGMISGFLPGFYVAATNGMFIGGFFGVAVGMILGIWNGKCCGVMGVMEGSMAGFMGGLMGAMTAFMLLNDHLRETSILVFLISAFIIFGLNYMIYKEAKHLDREMSEDHLFTVSATFILTAITTWLIVYGPRTGLLAIGA